MNCFDKARRLLKKSDYDQVFAKAKKIITSEFIILYRKNSLGYARLGLALSKKAVPKSHDRNRLKRLLRETFRTSQLPAIDVVILAKHGVAKIENKTLIANLGKTWDKLAASSAT
ncbi:MULTISPECIES: ribonuclease P protein component [unclassified Legionella]|uniref:ribonuclease P protein component n=1 Tax=unclassified Legionella TaxID=2622702 RepID=UPI0010569C21|nr:ribonuclease P protein component [Legionella sp. W10-070]MDI9817990.1 ribonuclease P protein component [Legionella sp. PL877]